MEGTRTSVIYVQ